MSKAALTTLTLRYAAQCSPPRLPPQLVACRLQHLGSLIQPIGRDEDEVAVAPTM